MRKYAIFMIICFVSLLTLVRADNDSNDSLDNAEAIGQGKSTGNVTSDWLMGDDEDYYVITIPANTKAIITFKFVEGDRISVDLFDNEMEEISEYISLDTPGEMEVYTRWNQKDTTTNLYVGMSGTGDYEIDLVFEELDNNDSLDEAEEISEGEFYGDVSKDSNHYEDVDYYKITVPAGNVVSVSITLVDGSSISMKGYDHDKNELSGFSMYLFSTSEIETETWKNKDKSAKNIYICLSGTGQYKITIEFIEGDNNDSLDEAEEISAGTFTGEVTHAYDTIDDEDYYVISVPSGATFIVTVKFEVAHDDYSTIKIQGYDHYKVEHNMFSGIWMYLDSPGETDTSSWKNNKDAKQNIYIGISGEGEYKMTIEIGSITTDDDEEPIPHDEIENDTCGGVIVLTFFSVLLGLLITFSLIKKKNGS